MTTVTRIQLGLLVAAAVLLAVLATALWRMGPPAGGAAPEVPRISGDFTLVDAAGESLPWAQINKRRQLVFFGFTHCPEACPATLLAASSALAERGASERDTRILFISVDPERDTPAVVGAYTRNFGPAVTGMTGDAAGIAAAAAAFHVFYVKTPPMADGGYMVDHTATLFLLGRRDEILAMIPYGASSAEIAAVLARHPG